MISMIPQYILAVIRRLSLHTQVDILYKTTYTVKLHTINQQCSMYVILCNTVQWEDTTATLLSHNKIKWLSFPFVYAHR